MSGQKKNSQSNSFLVQGSILALAGIMVRIIGIIYRVPLNSILGDAGACYYATAFDVYSLFLLISSMSMPIAVSKIVSARVAKGQFKNAYKAFVGALIFSVIIGMTVFLIVFFGAETFAEIWEYPSAALAIKTLAPTLFIMSILGVLRGFFQGMGTMMPTAVSQILEQVVNAIVSIVAALILFDMGEKAGMAEAYSAGGGTIGTGAGALTALLFVLLVFVIYRPAYKKKIRRFNKGREEDYRTLSKVLVFTIAPVLLSTTVYNLGSLIDSGVFGNVMADSFKMPEEEYSALMGIYSGKFKLLITAPIAVASSLSAAVIPSLVNSYTERNKRAVKNKIDATLKLTMLVAIPCGVGLSVLGLPIISMLFNNDTNADICKNIMYFSIITVVLYSLSTITNSILQGIDRMRVPVINASISLIIHIPLLLVLLLVFEMNIYGVVVADFIFAGIVCVLNNMALRKYIRYKMDVVNVLLKPIFSAAVMGGIALLVYNILSEPAGNTVSTLVAVFVAVVVYFTVMLLVKGITEDEVMMLPKGRKIVNLLKKVDLM